MPIHAGGDKPTPLREAKTYLERVGLAALNVGWYKERLVVWMALLNELKPGVLVKGLLPGGTITIIDVKRHGDIGAELIYKDSNGHLGTELLYRERLEQLEIVSSDLPWSFQADGALFRF